MEKTWYLSPAECEKPWFGLDLVFKNRHFESCFNLACSNWQINVIFTVADPDLELRGAWFFVACPAGFSSFCDSFSFFLLNAYRYFTHGRNEVLLTQRREPRLRLELKHMILFCRVYKDRLVLRFTSVFFGSLLEYMYCKGSAKAYLL